MDKKKICLLTNQYCIKEKCRLYCHVKTEENNKKKVGK